MKYYIIYKFKKEYYWNGWFEKDEQFVCIVENEEVAKHFCDAHSSYEYGYKYEEKDCTKPFWNYSSNKEKNEEE